MRRVRIGEASPDFRVQDLEGRALSPELLRGSPVLYIFHRYARCAVCNQRIRELRAELPAICERTGLKVVFFCHSDRERLRAEFGELPLPFELVPDPERTVYAKFGVATSLARTLRAKSLATIVHARRSMPDDGKPAGLERPLTVIPADFFADATGALTAVHYGEFLGDTWPTDTIARLADSASSRSEELVSASGTGESES